MSESRGRLDLLIKEGLGQLAGRLGIRANAQPVIDRFVDERMTAHRIPSTPADVAERLGLLRRPNRVVRNNRTTEFGGGGR